MKKFTIIALCLTILLSSVTYAAGYQQNILANFNTVILNVNGKAVNSGNILYNGTTYVPIRATAEALNCKVNWNNDTKTADIIGNSVDSINTSYIADIIDIRHYCDMIYDDLNLTYDAFELLMTSSDKEKYLNELPKLLERVNSYAMWISEKISVGKVKYVGGTDTQYNQFMNAVNTTLQALEKFISDINRYIIYRDINLNLSLDDFFDAKTTFSDVQFYTVNEWYYNALDILRNN